MCYRKIKTDYRRALFYCFWSMTFYLLFTYLPSPGWLPVASRILLFSVVLVIVFFLSLFRLLSLAAINFKRNARCTGFKLYCLRYFVIERKQIFQPYDTIWSILIYSLNIHKSVWTDYFHTRTHKLINFFFGSFLSFGCNWFYLLFGVCMPKISLFTDAVDYNE